MSDVTAVSETVSVGETVGALVSQLASKLGLAGVRDPRKEAVEIVAALLDVPRFWPAANGECEAQAKLVDAAIRAASKRALGAPLAYAVGRASFRHLSLEVDESVLIPRVETELLVERVLERCDSRTQTIADIGTGSGAIALSLAFERDFQCVIGTDLSRGALAIAEKNRAALAGVLRSPVEIMHGSFFAPLEGRLLDAVVSNPPYIAYAEGTALPASVRDWEPPLALLSADNGLSATRCIVAQAPRYVRRRGILALEVDVRRAGLVAEMIATEGSYTDIEVLLDLSGRERFVLARRS